MAKNKTAGSKGIIALCIVLILIFIVLPFTFGVIFALNFTLLTVNGPSMTPTISNGSKVLFDKNVTSINRCEVVLMKDAGLNVASQYQNLLLIKRVIGLPGDHVVIQNDSVTIYNAANPQGFDPDSGQNYLAPGTMTVGNVNEVVPSNSYFVLGDNRNDSLDSREFGNVPRKNITEVLANGSTWTTKLFVSTFEHSPQNNQKRIITATN